MPNRPLIIDVHANDVLNGTLNKWTPLENTTKFIESILTPKLSNNTNIGQLVSGIPSAFARVDLFDTALQHVSNETSDYNEGKRNLVGYYYELVQEWRGLIACMALDYAHISVRKIDLAYSDGKSISATANIYEPKGAFRNMLMEREDRWREQNLTETEAEKAVPYINIIKYCGKVVGATAPESLLFTSSGYSIEPTPEKPWIGINGKFIDPQKSMMTPQQVATLHAYVTHLIDSIDKITAYYSALPEGKRVDYTSVTRELEKWQEELAQKAEDEGFQLSIGSIPPVSAGFYGPFQDLFCHEDILYGREGVISENLSQGALKFDPKKLLLDEDAKIARINLNIAPEDIKNLPILVMTADIKGSKEKAYFALPLSAQGLNVYGSNVAALVGMSLGTTPMSSTLKATYSPTEREDNLEVVLTIKTENGALRDFKKVYSVTGSIENRDILIWPNFASQQWDAYFMYNEMPHNSTMQGYRAFPFVGEMQDKCFRIIVDGEQHPVLLSRDGNIIANPDIVKAEILIQSGDAVADNPYKYEIYQSNKPFKGVRLQDASGNEGGYILINYSSSQGTSLPKDMMDQGRMPTLQDVNLGIDFGSTNTSIAYSFGNNIPEGFSFANQRVSLMGNEINNNRGITRENDIFFFQSGRIDRRTPGNPNAFEQVKSNAVKSVLTLHDPRRLPDLQMGEDAAMRLQKAVIGGFPCFVENLPFEHSDQKSITLKFPGVGEVTQIHNMKWEDNPDDKAHKSAFLRTLMLHIYGTLFEMGYVPTNVKWSYPSAMAGHLLNSYNIIWEGLSNMSPVLDRNGERKRLKVSRYEGNFSFGGDSDMFVSGSNDSAFGSDNGGFGGFGANDNDGFGGFDSFGGGNDSFGGFGSDDNNGFGGFGSDIGFGSFGSNDDNSFGGGFGAETQNESHEQDKNKDLLPDDNSKPVEYKPKPIFTDSGIERSLSEAEAVANFTSDEHGRQADVLNLVFDVGGSTTDISALFILDGKVTMIKQNSLRFAAQRISGAVGKFPSFRNVLQAVCLENGIRMIGLNMGPDSYNETTAAYFYDQIVNRLPEDKLPSFYSRIGAECKSLMCVNLFVTGLLIYYAGQIAHKLVEDLFRTDTKEWKTLNRKLKIQVSFAGKGSRIFQWLMALSMNAANEYYRGMFSRGFGKVDKPIEGLRIVLPGLNSKNIKYEVSKGLAKMHTELQKPTAPQPAEIIGEEGFDVVGNDYVSRAVGFTNSMTPEMMKEIGNRFKPDTDKPQAVKFKEFLQFYYMAANKMFGFNPRGCNLNEALSNIVGYIQKTPEWRDAELQMRQSRQPFGFVAPIIILEGMKFYDETLINLLKG